MVLFLRCSVLFLLLLLLLYQHNQVRRCCSHCLLRRFQNQIQILRFRFRLRRLPLLRRFQKLPCRPYFGRHLQFQSQSQYPFRCQCQYLLFPAIQFPSQNHRRQLAPQQRLSAFG